MRPTYRSTKTFGHEMGLSAAFRQWRATHSHCRFVHGYALSIKLEFESEHLDARNWVMDFGGFKDIKKALEERFDHKLLVAADDPQKDELCALAGLGVADTVVVPAVGCEAFAQQIYSMVASWLKHNGHSQRGVRLASVEVKEHGANSAIYIG